MPPETGACLFNPAMFRPRTALIAALLIGLGLLLASLQDQQDREPYIERDENSPDTYILDGEITQFDAKGQVARSIVAKRLTHYPLNDVTELLAPRITLYRTGAEGAQPWHISAGSGKLFHRQAGRPERLELHDSFVAEMKQPWARSLHIEGQSIVIIPDQEYVLSQGSVMITGPDFRTLAGSLEAWLGEERLLLQSSDAQQVETTLLLSGREP